MLTYKNQKYELFFSNNIPPLIALNYADELFFTEFEKLCGTRYRILSIIRQGWQEKYGLCMDVEELQKHFEIKKEQKDWATPLEKMYEQKATILRSTLQQFAVKKYKTSKSKE